MAPNSRVILCRHSQAEHNVDLDYSIPDAPLTALGKKQSAALAPQIPKLQEEVGLIITSALKRTLQSTKLGWGPAVERLGIKNVICLPQAQECNDFPCDTGSPREHLESLDEFKDFNLELLTPDWTSKKGFYAPDDAALAKRAQWVRQYIRDRKESVIVLVAHGDILRRITCSAAGPSIYQWKNAEVREYTFDADTVGKEECYLIQREDVAHAGGYEQTSTDIDNLEQKPVVEIESLPVKTESKKGNGSMKPASSQQDGASTSSAPWQGMRDAKDVAKDPSIFTSENRIVFPNSDGDPAYGPPNLVVPPVTDSEVNYFHIFTRDEQKWVNWSKSIAQKLAKDYFNVPGDNWALKDFPTDYYMTEQRKGPRRTVRTDPYLYGSAGHRFRSTLEFMPHAYWLLCDPNLDPRNCRCIYCSKTPRGSGAYRPPSGTVVSGKRAIKQVKQYQSGDANSYRLLKPNYKIRAQAAPRGFQLPGVPLAINSCSERNDELTMIEEAGRGSCEGFRIGEFAYCRLKEAIVDEEDDGNKIEFWPVLIEESKTEAIVSDNHTTSQNGSFNLQGRVKQKRVYDVVFMPSHEKAKVDEDRLLPALMATIPKKLTMINLGKKEDHRFIVDKTSPELNVENGKKRLPFKQMLFCFLFATETFRNLRLLYTVTDQFSRTNMLRPAVKNVVFANGNGAEKEKTKQAEGETTAQGNRFLKSTEQNNYMDLDGDDRNSRRRTSTRTAARVSNGDTSMQDGNEIAALDENTYWQGILFGLERLWVGDLARLRLSVEDIGTMISSLAKGNDLYNAEDRSKVNTSSPYVIRIKAIYRIVKADVTKTDDKIRVAGDVFRVISEQEGEASAEKRNKRNRDGTNEEEGEEGSKKRLATDKMKGVTIKNEDVVGSIMSNRSRRSSTSPSSYSEKKSIKKKPTFEVPFRPFLEKAYDDQLPTTPTLPNGFVFQRVNQSSVEVVCSIQQLAGRLWSSVSEMPQDVELSIKEKKKPFYAHEDTSEPDRIRLSLCGLIAGATKAMEVHPNEGLMLSRDRAIAESSRLALEDCMKRLESIEKEIQGEGEGEMEEDDQGDVSMTLDEVQDQINHASRSVMTTTTTTKPTNGNKNAAITKSKATKASDEDLDSQAAAAAIIAAAKMTMASPTNTINRSETTSIATPSNGSIRASVATSTSERERSISPPLPPHWIKKTSRGGLGDYYANLKTKQTSWDRPKA